MATPCAPQSIPTPVITNWRYGLFSVAAISDVDHDHGEMCGVEADAPYCTPAVRTPDFVCPPAIQAEKAITDTDVNRVITGEPFGVHVRLSCRNRTPLDSLFDDARTAFNVGEQRGVEEAFWTGPQAGSLVGDLSDPCTILNTTPGAAGALSVLSGLAALESAMAAAYGGRAVIHSDRALAPYAASGHLIEKVNGDHYETTLGSLWAFYGASPNLGPDGLVAPAGMAWMYATSEVQIRRYPLEVFPPDAAHILDYPTNEPVVIAERRYTATRFCACYAVLVCLGCDS